MDYGTTIGNGRFVAQKTTVCRIAIFFSENKELLSSGKKLSERNRYAGHYIKEVCKP